MAINEVQTVSGFSDTGMVVKKRVRRKKLDPVNVELGVHGNTFKDLTEMNWDALTYPTSLETYKLMGKHLVISSALNLISTMMARVPWRIEAYEPKEADIKNAKFITEVFNDMDEGWQTFISEVSTMNQYGHSVHEIVLRYRRFEEGSRYNDGKIGLKYLPIRSQHSIAEWVYDPNGRTLLGLTLKIKRLSIGIKISFSL